MAKPEPFYIDVDLKKNTQYEVPSVTQMDTATFFIVRVTDDGRIVPGMLDYFPTITMTSERPDEKSFYILGKRVVGKENEILFHLGTDETALTGNVRAALQFYSVDGRSTSAQFRYNVDKDLSGEYVPSEREGSLIETVLIQGPKIMAAAEKATADAIKAMNDLTGAVSGALNTLETDKAAALSAAAAATSKANTAATTADSARTSMTSAANAKIAEVEAVRKATDTVRANTETERLATKGVKEAAEAERLSTKAEKEATATERLATKAVKESTDAVRIATEAAKGFAQTQGEFAKTQGDLQVQQMETVAGVMEYIQVEFLPDVAETIAETDLFVREAMKDQNPNGVGQIKIWTGTLAQYNAIVTKEPATVYMVGG